MMEVMRTTVSIDDHLLTQAKHLAARTNRTLGQVIEDALRVSIHEEAPASEPSRVALPTFGGTGLQPGVDLEDKEAMLELLDESPSG